MTTILYDLLFYTAIALLIASIIRAYLAVRRIDSLIWARLRYDPQGGAGAAEQGATLLGKQVVEVARRYIGVEEQPRGSNRGPHINDFLAHVGLPPGHPWCTAFVSFCVHKAAQELGMEMDFPKTGWTPSLLSYAKKKSRLITRNEIEAGVKPRPGWIALFYYPNLQRVAHSGIVERYLPLGMVVTIEGNTNNDGSREGYKVCRRLRKLKSIYAFVVI